MAVTWTVTAANSPYEGPITMGRHKLAFVRLTGSGTYTTGGDAVDIQDVTGISFIEQMSISPVNCYEEHSDVEGEVQFEWIADGQLLKLYAVDATNAQIGSGNNISTLIIDCWCLGRA